jgi:hypothetical protein
MTRKTLVVGAVVAALVLGACGSDKKSGTGTGTGAAGRKGLAVYTLPAFDGVVVKVVEAYNKAHPKGQLKVIAEKPGVMKKSVLTARQQIVVATANVFKKVVKGATTAPFGRNLAVIAVSKANPRHVANLSAFASTSGLRTQVCGVKTGIGNFTALVLLKNKIKPNPSTFGFDCDAKALKDVAAGKLDAVLLFRGGHPAPSGVTFITVPDAQNIVAPIKFMTSGHAAGLAAFTKFMTTPGVRGILTANGYLP